MRRATRAAALRAVLEHAVQPPQMVQAVAQAVPPPPVAQAVAEAVALAEAAVEGVESVIGATETLD